MCRYKVLFYDSNKVSNIIKHAENFVKGLSCESKLMYSDAIHGIYNHRTDEHNGICGSLTFLENFLCFKFNCTPFNRKSLKTRKLRNNRDDGQHGSVLFQSENEVPYRNQNIPRYQHTDGIRSTTDNN